MLKRVLAALLLLIPAVAAAQGTVAPTPFFLALDNNGNPINNAKLCSYVAGSTTPAATYATSSLTVANANPVRTNSAGRASVFLAQGAAYKFVLRTAGSDNTCDTGTILWTQDGLLGTPTTSGNLDVLGTAGEGLTAGQVVYLSDGSGSRTAGSWYKADAGLSYASLTPTIGIVPNDILNGVAGTIRLGGQATGLLGLANGQTYYVSATPGGLTNVAPPNRRIVGVADSTTTLILFPPFATGLTTSTITTTGTQTALAIPSGAGPLTVFANNATLLTLQGIAAAVDGQVLSIYSIGAGQVDFANQSGSATALNRIVNGVTGTISLSAGSGRVTLQYDGTAARWRVLAHEQGAYITPTFNAADFTGSGGTWTVAVGDRGTFGYYLRGRALTVQVVLATTSVQAGSSTLRVVLPGGFTASQDAYNVVAIYDNAGTRTAGAMIVVGTSTLIQFQRLDAANWAAATDATAIFGTLTFEVQ